jgi:hypothetical protein
MPAAMINHKTVPGREESKREDESGPATEIVWSEVTDLKQNGE